jgi:hypothetical protein
MVVLENWSQLRLISKETIQGKRCMNGSTQTSSYLLLYHSKQTERCVHISRFVVLRLSAFIYCQSVVFLFSIFPFGAVLSQYFSFRFFSFHNSFAGTNTMLFRAF